MAVSAHDERDYAFAKKFDLPIRKVVEVAGGQVTTDGAFTAEGVAVNSPVINGLSTSEAKERMIDHLHNEGFGRKSIKYKLRDWLFSRQRYWGEPFPVLWVNEADYRKAAAARATDLPPEPVTYRDTTTNTVWFALPLPAAALPLTLPEVQSYLPSGNGESPLANVTEWLEVWVNVTTGEAVPASQSKPAGDTWIRGRRETNTMPQWAGSCWYYLRFLDPKNEHAFADPKLLAYWGVPDLYVGGAEHAVLHLLYARFWHKVLFDLGVVPQAEPFTKLFHQGIILGEDGEKMSKSRGNTVNPDDIIATHGTDTLRLYLMFLGPLEAMKPWNPNGIEGVHRFLQKVWRECIGREGEVNPKISDDASVDSADLVKLLHETIKKVGDDIEAMRFNTAISQMMICVNAIQKTERVSLATVRAFLQVLAPLAPHITEELWARLGGTGSIQQATWPQFDPAKLIATEQKVVVQVNGKKRAELLVAVGTLQDAALQLAINNEASAPFLAGKTIKRVVFVPGKILNIVVE